MITNVTKIGVHCDNYDLKVRNALNDWFCVQWCKT